ncbi:YSIRK-type signal peptide-containing protein [Streptococcus pneumoniae]
MFKSNYERKMCYSIRKFSIGVASVSCYGKCGSCDRERGNYPSTHFF